MMCSKYCVCILSAVGDDIITKLNLPVNKRLVSLVTLTLNRLLNVVYV